MNITFRETDMSSIRDSEAIVILLNEFMQVRNATDVKKINSSIIQKLKRLGTAKVYLCEYSNDIIGIAVCFVGFSTYKQQELLNIHDFFIREVYQGKGIGTRFLEYIEEDCIKNNFCRITLEVYDANVNAV